MSKVLSGLLFASAMFLSLPGQAWMEAAPPQDVQLQQDSEVHFQDQMLETAIRQQLQKKDDAAVTTTDMASLTTLNLTGVKSIAGLQYATNLTQLYLSAGEVEDIRPLSALTKLTSLNLSDNHIADLSPLKPLTKLQSLYLTKNRITDLQALAGLTRLSSLYAGNNQIKDLAPLKKMTQLVDLNFAGNLVYDLEPLRSLKNIAYLDLSYNRVWNLEPIRNHTFAHYYDTGALIYGLNFVGNYLDLRRTSSSYKILNALEQMDSPSSTTPIKKFERLVIGSTTAYIWESPFQLTHAPFIVSDRTYVPIRFVSKWLGAEVGWDQTKKEVTIRKGTQTIRWTVNEKNADVNGQTVPYDVPMLLKNNSAFVPVRFVSERLDASVEYMTNPKTVLIFDHK
ncbi:stalk domain-containing protein [Cohnella hashimotonis]|uniref:Stalk domain-containing protein n=1 Tax=Cohnella hashimotonis TaxID=2826895 RepID=A0ABT6TMD2_9BACL|nr:stalk domain-containing protein [Cohnella hashimotonis]MDI4647894.1 stalk domain-containing protein [Cohnella hashimotonis]